MKPLLPYPRCAPPVLAFALGAAGFLFATTANAQSTPRLDNQTSQFPPVSPVRSRLAHPPTQRPESPTGYNTGMPFGLIGERELKRLQAFTQRSHVDLLGDIRAACEGDEVALARVFAFSTRFDRLDANARTYGQIVYSAMLNLGGQRGLPWFARIVAAQPPEVRQRVRDFLFYDATQAPRKHRAEAQAATRRSAPELFPADYVFGAGNPLFKRQ